MTGYHCDKCGKEFKVGDYVAIFANKKWGKVNEGLMLNIEGESLYGNLSNLGLHICSKCSHLHIINGTAYFTTDPLVIKNELTLSRSEVL